MKLSQGLILMFLFGTAFSTASAQLYSPGAGVAPVTNGTSNVGIGTAAPTATLEVNGNLKTSEGIRARQYITVDKDGSYRVALNGMSDGYIVGRNDAAEGKFIISSNGNSYFNGGNVGVGTSSPTSQLHLASNENHAITLSRLNGDYGFRILRNAIEGNVYFQIGTGVNSWETKIKIGEGEGPNTKLLLNPDGGNIGIGTTSPDSKLTVKGDIHTREVRVDMAGSVAGDYVFEKDYDLLSLSDLESYINENKHLPEVPSAKEMEANGLNLKEMNLILLKKVEELTLHLIELKKETEAQQRRIDHQQTQINNLLKKQ